MGVHIVLFEPLIPANTGNIARTCAATNSKLHLIKPLGFSTDDKALKRAGLDYWEHVDISYHESLDDFFTKNKGAAFFYITKFAEKHYCEIDYAAISGDIFLLFGKETTGLPKHLLSEHPERGLRLPMNDDHVRSLNLSNTAAIVIYEVLRQKQFTGLRLQ